MQLVMVIGRILFSLVFILAGINKIFHWDGSEQALVNAMLDLLSETYEKPWAQQLFDQLIPHSSKLLLLSTVIELVAGLLIFLGLQVRLGALILFLFLVPTTLLFHSFWFAEGSMRELQMQLFVKNIGLMGGCWVLMACGSCKKGKKKEG